MKQTNYQDLINRNLRFYNFYNLDLNINTYYSSKYYNDYDTKEDNKEQNLSIVFLDIEVYQENRNIPFRFDESNHPISAISINFKNNYYCYFLHKRTENIKQWEQDFKLDLIKGSYISNNENIDINIYDDEKRLILECWKKIRELNPFILSGFNSDNFDYPYIYRRFLKLFDNDEELVHKILSQFEYVEFRNNKYVDIPEFTICDLLYLYKVREDGGLNLGSKQPSYTLDYISTVELNLTKFDYKDENANLNDFYEKDPKNYLFYNLVDVILCKRLNDKLRHIELHNSIRRTLKNSFSKSLVGNSSSFDSYVLYEELKQNNFIRFGMSTETGKLINEEELSTFPKLVDRKKIIAPTNIDNKAYGSIISKFKGAHVNSPTPRIIKDGSLIIDLDASIPPWETIIIIRDDVIQKIPIENYTIQQGDKALTWDNDNNICWKKVTNIFRHIWSKEHGQLLKVFTENRNHVTVTDNHSIYCIQENVNSAAPYLIEAKKLKTNDLLLNSNGNLEKITNIFKYDYNGYVYDISVEDTERFFAGTGIGIKNSSLYPSMMLQSNISFDVYTARIINPVNYKFLTILENKIGREPLDLRLVQSIQDLCMKYVDIEDVQNKKDTMRDLYYTCSYLLQKLFREGENINSIYNPTCDKDRYLLQFYLIPLLDILNYIHPKSESYNTFMYDYLFDFDNLENIYSYIYILEMPISTKQKILKLTVADALEYIKKYSLTIVGTCFIKHEEKLGLFTNLLYKLFKERKYYQAETKKYSKNSEEYNFNNSRQKSIKIIMNSIYGVLGLKSFRYSNHHLAQSITSQGRLSIKTAQYITEKYLQTQEFINHD
jgi:DNA polymerase elongation subunit (family B)